MRTSSAAAPPSSRLTASSRKRWPTMPLPMTIRFIAWCPLRLGCLRRLPAVEKLEHAAAQMNVAGIGSKRETLARSWQVHFQHFPYGRRGTVGHHDHAVGKQDRLIHVVSHHERRGAGACNDADQLVLECGAGERVQC